MVWRGVELAAGRGAHIVWYQMRGGEAYADVALA